MSKRLKKLKIGIELTVEEKTILVEILFAREAALAWTFDENGLV